MNMAHLLKLAKSRGLKLKVGTPKGEVIHAIQLAEGNSPCFGTANGTCDQRQCAWRDDCLGPAAARQMQGMAASGN